MLISGCSNLHTPSLEVNSSSSTNDTASNTLDIEGNDTASNTLDIEGNDAIILVEYHNWIDNDTQQNEFSEYTLSDDEADTIVNLFYNHEIMTVDSPIASVATLCFQCGEDYLTTSLDSLNILSGRINGELVVVFLSESEYKEVHQIVSQYVQGNP